jgi:glycosyltransferase involved in cell wall biosynthesis
VEVVPTGVDLTRFQPGERAAARCALGLPATGPVLLYVGRLDREKNLEFLLDAVGRIGGLALPRLLLVGRGTRTAALRALAARRLGGRVEFRGGVPPEEVGRFYRAADVFVFASTTETQGLAVLEAMACGLPVVAVRSAGVEEVLADGVSGLLVPEEPGAFAAAVAEVLADRDLAEKLAAGGREAAAAFAMPLVLARVVAAYRRAAAEAGRG